MKLFRQVGFTLLEMIIVIVLVAGAGTAAMALFGQSARSLIISEEVQTAVQLAQECADQIIKVRRATTTGYATAVGALATICTPAGGIPAYAGYTVTPTGAAIVANPPCPAGANCTLVTITADRGATTYSVLTLLLVDAP